MGGIRIINLSGCNKELSLLKTYRWIIVFSLCIILTMGYIFHHSLQPSEVSNQTSGAVVEQVKPIVDPKNHVSEEEMNEWLRKLAHGLEFCVLGIFLALFSHQIQKQFHKTDLCFPLLVALATGVVDEFIQSFHDRTSAVKDVLIDFGGAVVGIALVLFGLWLLRKRKEAN